MKTHQKEKVMRTHGESHFMSSEVKNKIQEATKPINDDIAEILRGEISAVETCNNAMQFVDKEMQRALHSIAKDHEAATAYWKKQSIVPSHKIKDSSGLWGGFVETLMDLSKVAGDKGALMTLKKGEEYGLSMYEKKLGSESLGPFQKDRINNFFIPNQKKHIQVISRLINKLDRD